MWGSLIWDLKLKVGTLEFSCLFFTQFKIFKRYVKLCRIDDIFVIKQVFSTRNHKSWKTLVENKSSPLLA